ncbi:MAG: CDGSH iron-sulfur domain-containing protein [Nitrososphaerota archaeon]|uniref:CDGSH iron-sulfur domain-containing protein n=1 Tax=Candidatus Bathycorpusculum sp. TaxID=2994959 RepID=UPI00281716E7|nr:CDGSH iron-sulfur domain-containing protein [Candidatus Termitimicrobium sp.]MCL2432154.1 CDGSH iron-sulfur domain-containing protein [Candidatus Termitimicrobium sp.]MDR0493855.1 CDGSH iron-sulfur domain-containing protein [Nitrososphaerota archaeon]
MKNMGNTGTDEPKSNGKIQVTKDGPYMVLGGIPLYRMIIKCDHSITPSEWVVGEKLETPSNYALCRCGETSNKPFCDGTHIKNNFKGTETSKNTPFETMANSIEGPKITLKDAEILCASARFCHRNGDIWNQISQTNEAKIKENCIENACTCPSGRLAIVDKEAGNAVEPKLDQAIGLIEDPSIGRDGPLWVRSGIPVYSTEGKLYEIRNRMTLCRCGKSTNKPFCDSSHYPEEDHTERKK